MGGVSRMRRQRQVALAGRCVDAVLLDLHRTIGDRALVVVDWHDGGVRIATEEGYTSPSMWASDPEGALAEVADYLQGQLTHRNPFAWPLCDLHETGLHAEVREALAVWWCPIGEHVVARIGHRHDHA